ncbi:MAG: hypothetical protein ABW184_06065 [Sphingobium sp.]
MTRNAHAPREMAADAAVHPEILWVLPFALATSIAMWLILFALIAVGLHLG